MDSFEKALLVLIFEIGAKRTKYGQSICNSKDVSRSSHLRLERKTDPAMAVVQKRRFEDREILESTKESFVFIVCDKNVVSRRNSELHWSR